MVLLLNKAGVTPPHPILEYVAGGGCQKKRSSWSEEGTALSKRVVATTLTFSPSLPPLEGVASMRSSVVESTQMNSK